MVKNTGIKLDYRIELVKNNYGNVRTKVSENRKENSNEINKGDVLASWHEGGIVSGINGFNVHGDPWGTQSEK